MGDLDKTSILLVDDLPEKLLAYASILEELGQDLVTARSGEEALRCVLRADFAVILLDVHMPGMNGLETAQLIRNRKRSAHTPIIFLTAFADEVLTTRGYATGAVDYMTTPVVPEVLRAKVRVFVELFRMRQQVARQAEEQAKRAAAEESARRSAFLAESSRALADSLAFDDTVRTLARLSVPDLADVSFVCLTSGGRPEVAQAAWDGGGGPVRLSRWLAEEIERAVASPDWDRVVRLEEPRQTVEGADAPGPVAGSVVILPLAARARTLGALALATRPGRELTPQEVTLAAEVCGRAGVALDNALLVRDIQENDQRRNEFLAMLSHELRNPLAPICNALRVLQFSGIRHPTLDWAGGVIGRQVDHMVRLVDDLLDVSRITRGKIRLQTEPVDLADVVASAVETVRPLVEAHRHRLVVSLPEPPIRIRADRTRLAQVVSNLLNNAAKYTPDGGEISLAVYREGGEVVMKVWDTGTGIAADMLPKVFDLFTQADRAIDRAQGGLGIGLTLVRRLVELHGGRVEAFSEGSGRGSEFVVRLAAAEEPAGATAAVTPVPPTARPERVLVVDDNVDAADSLCLLLEVTGHTTRQAHDGPSAIEMSASFQPDVILLDIGLPGLDGYQVARRMREQAVTARSMIVAVSGYGQQEDRLKAREAGFDHHLTKPVAFGELQAILAQSNKPRKAGP